MSAFLQLKLNGEFKSIAKLTRYDFQIKRDGAFFGCDRVTEVNIQGEGFFLKKRFIDLFMRFSGDNIFRVEAKRLLLKIVDDEIELSGEFLLVGLELPLPPKKKQPFNFGVSGPGCVVVSKYGMPGT